MRNRADRSTTKPSRNHLAIGLAITLAIAVTTVVNRSFFDDTTAQRESDGATVRISALKSESGAVRVALQQQQVGGAWAERRHPDLNTVRTDASTGVWLNSSPLQIAAPSAEDGPLFCVVSHGARNDFFWRLVRGYSRQAAIDAGMNVRFSLLPDPADQAAEIERCSADGASVIAATLASPDAVRGALLSAKAAGARIITFNSGSESAASVGSELHLALDEAAAGRLVGNEFNRRGLTGDIGCLIHESQNVGLDVRCQALSETYTGGATHRIQLPDGADSASIREVVTERLLDPDQPGLNALLALNADTFLDAFAAIVESADQLDHVVQIASIGQKTEISRIPLADRQRHLAFLTNHAGEAQGYLITSALLFVHSYPAPASFISTPTVLSATPFIFDGTTIKASPQVLIDTVRRVQQRLDLGEEYDE